MNKQIDWNETGIQCQINEEDVAEYEKHYPFYVAKFLSTLLVLPIAEMKPSLIKRLCQANILEAVADDVTRRRFLNSTFGAALILFLERIEEKSERKKLLLFFTLYTLWNINFCIQWNSPSSSVHIIYEENPSRQRITSSDMGENKSSMRINGFWIRSY